MPHRYFWRGLPAQVKALWSHLRTRCASEVLLEGVTRAGFDTKVVGRDIGWNIWLNGGWRSRGKPRKVEAASSCGAGTQRRWLPKREGTTKWEARWGWHHNSNLRLDDEVVGSAARSSGKAGGRIGTGGPAERPATKGQQQRPAGEPTAQCRGERPAQCHGERPAGKGRDKDMQNSRLG